MTHGNTSRLGARRPAVWALRIVLIAALLLELALLWQGYAYGAPGTNDFIEYWSAGQLLRNGENPYDFQRLSQIQHTFAPSKQSPLIILMSSDSFLLARRVFSQRKTWFLVATLNIYTTINNSQFTIHNGEISCANHATRHGSDQTPVQAIYLAIQ